MGACKNRCALHLYLHAPDSILLCTYDYIIAHPPTPDFFCLNLLTCSIIMLLADSTLIALNRYICTSHLDYNIIPFAEVFHCCYIKAVVLSQSFQLRSSLNKHNLYDCTKSRPYKPLTKFMKNYNFAGYQAIYSSRYDGWLVMVHHASPLVQHTNYCQGGWWLAT